MAGERKFSTFAGILSAVGVRISVSSPKKSSVLIVNRGLGFFGAPSAAPGLSPAMYLGYSQTSVQYRSTGGFTNPATFYLMPGEGIMLMTTEDIWASPQSDNSGNPASLGYIVTETFLG